MIMVNKLEKKLQINMHNKNLLQKALTHSSFVNENPMSSDNETLEFLGDAVIELLMSSHLYYKGYENEGELSKRRAQAVCEEALYIYAKALNLGSYIRIGKGLDITKARENMTINADAFEAIFGAFYLDLGFEKTKELFNRLIVPHLHKVENIRDYKSALQECVQTGNKNVVYELISEKGPSHNKEFTIIVKLDNKILGYGKAGSKKEAEQKAAKEALLIIEKEQMNDRKNI